MNRNSIPSVRTLLEMVKNSKVMSSRTPLRNPTSSRYNFRPAWTVSHRPPNPKREGKNRAPNSLNPKILKPRAIIQ